MKEMKIPSLRRHTLCEDGGATAPAQRPRPIA